MCTRNVLKHSCAFIVFWGCIATVIVLLTKFRVSREEVTGLDFIIDPGTTPSSGNVGLTYWTGDSSLNYARANHEAVLLANGKVMVGGGWSDSNTQAQTCEFYSPSTDWQLGPVMNTPRYYYTLTPFASNAKVLAVGGRDPASLQTAEIYDSSTNTWTLTMGNLSYGRFAHGAARLNNDQILITGGIDNSGFVLYSTELFIPSSNSFMKVKNLNIGRVVFATTVLKDGSTVLVTGGGDPFGFMSPTGEIYSAGSWMLINRFMTQPRAYHAAVLLQDGSVLIAGGGNGKSISYSSTEIYNPTTGTFQSVGSMSYRRALFTLTLLPSGKVLATGGIDWTSNTYPATCELYDPVAQTWSATQILNNGRSFHQSILLSDSVLTIGGYIMPKNQSKTCEKYKF